MGTKKKKKIEKRTQKVSIRLRPSFFLKIKKFSKKHKVSYADIIEAMIEDAAFL